MFLTLYIDFVYKFLKTFTYVVLEYFSKFILIIKHVPYSFSQYIYKFAKKNFRIFQSV